MRCSETLTFAPVLPVVNGGSRETRFSLHLGPSPSSRGLESVRGGENRALISSTVVISGAYKNSPSDSLQESTAGHNARNSSIVRNYVSSLHYSYQALPPRIVRFMDPLYYYADSSNKAQGPFTLPELIALRGRGVITNTTQTCQVNGTRWQPFSSLLPASNLPPPPPISQAQSAEAVSQSADVRPCPQCASMVSTSAYKCPSCQFSIADFDENRRAVKFTKMEHIPYAEEDIGRAILKVYKRQNAGCQGVAALVIGILIAFIPYVGWILAPFVILFGLFMILAPVRGPSFFDKHFSVDRYNAMVRQAKIMLESSFRDVKCPLCGRKEREIRWFIEAGSWTCRGCHKPLLRERNYLFFLPKPDAVPNKNIIKSFLDP